MIRAVLLSLLLVGLALPAFGGGNVCILQEAGAIQTLSVLTKPKLPKGPGTSVPLAGFFDVSPEAPLSGTLSRGITGSLRAGITLHMDGGVACFEHLSIDDTFEGDGSATCSDEPDNEIPITWTPTAC